MKKVISIVTIFVFALVLNSAAQITSNPGGGTALTYELENVLVTSIKINEGSNTVRVPNNRGTVKFDRRGTTITNVIYIDAAGKTTRLVPGNGAANGGQTPNCKCPIPDACFGTADKKIGLCICKPCNLSNGQETYTIGLLLPAVQKVREAAARMK